MASEPQRRVADGAIVSVALALLILGAIVLTRYFFFAHDNNTTIDIRRPGGSVNGGGTPAEATLPDPDAPHRSQALWLEASDDKHSFSFPGAIARELMRQALLLSARDELGLETRDASLREWRKLPAAADQLQMDFAGNTVTVAEKAHPGILWTQDLDADLRDGSHRYQRMLVDAEALSRGDFIRILRRRGWAGSANKFVDNAPVPADAETLLGRMDELSQFAALRETYALIRSSGESLPRLAVLVRAYANLGQLTRYHYSTEYAVYAARSLLYGQRMVSHDRDSTLALRTLAYAQALAGLQGDALRNLTEAREFDKLPPPQLAAMVEAYSQYHASELIALASRDRSAAPLGMFLAYLAVENNGWEDVRRTVAQRASAVNPDCLRLLDADCIDTRQVDAIAPPVYAMSGAIARNLAQSIPAIAGLPTPIRDQVLASQPGGEDLTQRESACQAMIDRGTSLQDTGEPSLAVLGRMIQEITFAEVQRMQMLMVTDTDAVNAHPDYAAKVAPVIADHPFRCMIPTYDAISRQDMDAARTAMAQYLPAARLMTLGQFQMWEVAKFVGLNGPDGSDNMWNCIFHNLDYTACDLEPYLACHHPPPDARATLGELDVLRVDSPESPLLLTFDASTPWTEAKIARWEAHSDYPRVAMPLGIHYAAVHDWPDAERCFKNYVAVSPDVSGFQWLATIYSFEGKSDQYQAALKEAQDRAQAGDDARNQVACDKITNDINHGNCKEALSYADEAAAIGNAVGLQRAGDAHAAVHDWATAEQLMQQAVGAGGSPFRWYALCLHSGRGDRAATTPAMQKYFSSPIEKMSDEDLVQLGVYQLISGSNDAALQTFQRRMQGWPGPLSADTIAVIADELGDATMRDAALDQACAGRYAASALSQFATVLRDAVNSGPAVIPDAKQMDQILNAAGPADRDTICLLAAIVLDHRGQHDAATAYLLRYPAPTRYSVDRAAIDAMLLDRGIDPLTLKPATRPATVPSPK